MLVKEWHLDKKSKLVFARFTSAWCKRSSCVVLHLENFAQQQERPRGKFLCPSTLTRRGKLMQLKAQVLSFTLITGITIVFIKSFHPLCFSRSIWQRHRGFEFHHSIWRLEQKNVNHYTHQYLVKTLLQLALGRAETPHQFATPAWDQSRCCCRICGASSRS